MKTPVYKILAAHLISSECDLDNKTKCIRCMFENEDYSDEIIEENINDAIRIAKKWLAND